MGSISKSGDENGKARGAAVASHRNALGFGQRLIPIFACIVALLPCSIASADDATDIVDTDARHQVIDNFGASDAWTMKGVGTWSLANKNKIADLLFSTDRGIGLSLWRFNIGGGTNTASINNPDRSPETFEVSQGKYDWTRQAPERWFANAARARGVAYLLGFVNSPPGRLTRNGLTNSGDDEQSSTNLMPGCEDQYARYLCDIIQHFRDEPDPKQKLIFNFISPVNEPQIDWSRGSQEGNRCDNPTIKKILLALHHELEAGTWTRTFARWNPACSPTCGVLTPALQKMARRLRKLSPGVSR